MSTKALRLVGWGLLVAGALEGLNPAGASTSAIWLAALLAWLTVIAWLGRDAVNHRIPLPYDWSWLIIISWPVLCVWYVRRSRRSWTAALGLAAFPMAFLIGALITQLATSIVV